MTAVELTILILVALTCVTCVSITIIFERRSERRKESGTIYVVWDEGNPYLQLGIKDTAELDRIVDGRKKKIVLNIKRLTDVGDENV